MKVNVVLFDLDGTITDSAPGIINSIRYALEKHGLDVPAENELRKFVGPPLKEQFQEVFGLPATGIVDYPTWYKISEIYVAVSRIAELN